MNKERLKQMNDEWAKHIDDFFVFGEPESTEKTYFQFGYQAALPQWISVDEQPPTTEGDYLFYCPTDGGFQEVYTVDFTVDGDWYLTDGLADVTHWMPLPSSPEQ